MYSRSSLRLILLFLMVLAACDTNSGNHTGNTGTGDPEVIENGDALPMEEDDLRDLLARGSQLYWSIPAAGTSTITDIDGHQMMQVDSAAFPSLDSLRQHLRTIFTGTAAHDIIEDFGIVERNGKLWMIAGDGGDVREYDDADIVESSATQDSLHVKLDIPLGDSGQSDMVSVRLVRTKDGWKLDSDPYGGDDL